MHACLHSFLFLLLQVSEARRIVSISRRVGLESRLGRTTLIGISLLVFAPDENLVDKGEDRASSGQRQADCGAHSILWRVFSREEIS